MMYKTVSVIVPIYNVGKFIGKCVESLMKQTLDGVQFIFVDDGTPDDSISVLQDIIRSHPEKDISIIHHTHNMGLPSARNSGLAIARGEYILHCDGDDWVEEDMLEKLYEKGRKENADIVYCDFFLSYENGERRIWTPDFHTGGDLLRRGLLNGTMKYNVWNKLVRRSIYTENGITFPDGHPMGEDMTMIMLTACAKKVTKVPEALYHYVQTNYTSYSKTSSPKQLEDTLFNVKRTEDFLRAKNESLEKEIGLFKLSIKLPFLISESPKQYEIWRKWFPEANRFIYQDKYSPIRTKFIEWCAWKKLDTILYLYNVLVYRIIYPHLLKSKL